MLALVVLFHDVFTNGLWRIHFTSLNLHKTHFSFLKKCFNEFSFEILSSHSHFFFNFTRSSRNEFSQCGGKWLKTLQELVIYISPRLTKKTFRILTNLSLVLSFICMNLTAWHNKIKSPETTLNIFHAEQSSKANRSDWVHKRKWSVWMENSGKFHIAAEKTHTMKAFSHRFSYFLLARGIRCLAGNVFLPFAAVCSSVVLFTRQQIIDSGKFMSQEMKITWKERRKAHGRGGITRGCWCCK